MQSDGLSDIIQRVHAISADILPVIADTMFELVKALNDGAEELRKRVPNPIGLNAGCELFIAFVTLFPHESTVCVFFGLVFDAWFHTDTLRRVFPP